MQSTDIPTKFPIPFAASAGPAYIRPVPAASQIGIQAGAASLADGFVPLNFTPVGGGGVPPFGQDVNGLLYQITAWARYASAGGPVAYDAAFSTAIGGYPAGAVLQAAGAPGAYWVSTAENNSTNPDAGGAGWVFVLSTGTYVAAAGTNTLTATVAGSPAAYQNGQTLRFRAAAANTAAVTLQIGSGAARPVQRNDGGALAANDLEAGGTYAIVYDSAATAWRLVSAVPSQLAGGGLTVDSDGSIKVNIPGSTSKPQPEAGDMVLIWDTILSVYKHTTAQGIAGLAAYSDEMFAQTYFMGMLT